MLVLRTSKHQPDIVQVYRTVTVLVVTGFLQIYDWYFGPRWSILLGSVHPSGRCFDNVTPFTDRLPSLDAFFTPPPTSLLSASQINTCLKVCVWENLKDSLLSTKPLISSTQVLHLCLIHMRKHWYLYQYVYIQNRIQKKSVIWNWQ